MQKHPLQSREWGEFREKTGVRVVNEGGIQATIHKIPYTPWSVGYVPKGPMPDNKQLVVLEKIAKENSCILIKCEPMVEQDSPKIDWLKSHGFVEGRPLFTKYNFVLDVGKSEEELLKNMKQKTRYNIKLAARKGVRVEIDNSQAAFERYLELTAETTERQGFYAHSNDYHRKMWQVMSKAGIANILSAKYEGKIITTWIIFKYGDTLYYPYGASSRENREVMANNLVMWEAIKLAKKWGCKYLDMWGALGPNPNERDPWYGFHKFKEGYEGRHVEYIGTFDYVAKPLLYTLYRAAEWIRWQILHLLK